MYVIDGIAYAGEAAPMLEAKAVQAMENHILRVRFNDGAVRDFDFKPLLNRPAFAPLKDEALFRTVALEYGVPVWCDGDIDIDPEWLYAGGISATT